MRILSIDYGKKYIGLALSDPTGTIAYPHKTLESNKNVFKVIRDICENENVGQIVAGIPIGFKGETEQTKETRNFISRIKKELNIPVEEENEIFSSKIAKARMLKGADRHQQAAVVILEGWLNKLNI